MRSSCICQVILQRKSDLFSDMCTLTHYTISPSLLSLCNQIVFFSFYSSGLLHHIFPSTHSHSTTDLAGNIHDNAMVMGIRMFSTPTQQPFCRLIYLLIYWSFPHCRSSHPSCMLAAQASVAACHSEFQMGPIFPLMARRSGRQHIGEGGPRHAACSRGSIREKTGTRVGRGG